MLLSKEHGLNPTIPVCYFCGQPKNEVVLTGLAGERAAKKMGHHDGQMPMHACIDTEPCEQCREYMKQGIIIIEIEDETLPEENHRTGGFYVIKEEALKDILNEDMYKRVSEMRVMIIEESTAEYMGLHQAIQGE